MSSALIFSSFRRRKSPLSGVFFTPSDLCDFSLIRALARIAIDHASAYDDISTSLPLFQRRNCRSLICKIRIFFLLLRFLGDGASLIGLPPSATTCLKEIYILIHRARNLLEFCSQTSRLWLLLQNPQISGHFHDLNVEIATILDVFPLRELGLEADVLEQIELIHRICRRSRLFVDSRDEALRLRVLSFLEEFEQGDAPDSAELREAFVHRLQIRDAEACHSEIKFLEEQINSQDENADPSVLGGVIALVRYCRFRLFRSVEEEEETNVTRFSHELGGSPVTIPKDFCCPISLDLMRDPVIISSGQTYDRPSITHWMDDGHCTCPNSGQMLSHSRLMPNRALRSLIADWCAAQGIAYDPPDGYEEPSETAPFASASRAAVMANRKTAQILLGKLAAGSESEIMAAAREIRLLAKTGKENRACIAELGVLPLLESLLSSPNSVIQENSVTAILNLSILETNKRRIMELDGCLSLIVNVLVNGLVTEARENAAATLFSLSAVHAYKKRIADERGAVEALSSLLREGTPRGKKDAVTALYNISTHPECSTRMVASGAVSALVEALATDGVAEEAAGALSLLARKQSVAVAVGRDDGVVANLIVLLRRGSAKGRENAVAALHELCRSGGTALTQKVARIPALGGLIQSVLFTGTKRARRKAASLVRLCQRSEPAMAAAAASPLAGGRELEFAIARNDNLMPRSSVSVSVGISVPVL